MPKSCKAILNEFTQKQHLQSGPIYSTCWLQNSSTFTSSVTVDGKAYACYENFTKKKHTEESAARRACAELGLSSGTVNDSSKQKSADVIHLTIDKESSNEIENQGSSGCDETPKLCKDIPDKPYRSILNQRLQKQHITLPTCKTKIVTEKGIRGFRCEITLLGVTYKNPELTRAKRSAVNYAAKACLNDLDRLDSRACAESGLSLGTLNNPSKQKSLDVTDLTIDKESSKEIENQGAPGCNKTPTPKLRVENQLCKDIPDKPYRAILNQRLQIQHITLPTCKTKLVTEKGIRGFRCEITLLGVTYKNPQLTRAKKSAINYAAKACLDDLNTPKATALPPPSSSPLEPNNLSQNKDNNIHKENPRKRSFEVIASSFNVENPLKHLKTASEGEDEIKKYDYKSLLQEHIQQRGFNHPRYNNIVTESGLYLAFCQIQGKQVRGNTPRVKKKDSEQDAAKEGLIHLGVTDPDKVFQIRSGKHPRQMKKAKRKLAGNPNSLTPSSKTWWLHTRQEEKDITDDSFADDTISCGQSYLSFDPPAHSECVAEDLPGDNLYDIFYDQNDDDNKDDPLRFWNDCEPTFNGMAISKIPDLSVGEDWPDRRSVLVVGNSRFSIPLKCMGSTKEIYCLNRQSNVELAPGANIKGLVCKYFLVGSTLYLKAKCCKDVIFPSQPLPVLLSCGIVFVHYDPKSSEPLQILLERYLNSLAFMHAACGLMQWFRRYVNKQRIPLNVQSITKHIHKWLDEEVKLLANINQDSLKIVFSQVWKINNRFLSTLQYGLPEDLSNLQRRCQKEVHRRNSDQKDADDEPKRPWNLPKGNFKHRLLTTGIFIESGPECACRELKEETGVKLTVDEIETCSYVDIPHIKTENLNPHEGDFVRYYLYLHRAEPKECTGNGHANNQMNNGIQDGGNAAAQSIAESKHDERSFEEAKRGTKRKRDDGSLNLGEREHKRIMTENSEEPVIIDSDSDANENVVQLDPVRTTIREECTWKSIDAAVQESVVFKRIYETEQFKIFLNEVATFPKS